MHILLACTCLYIKGNYSYSAHFQVPFSGLYIQFWLYVHISLFQICTPNETLGNRISTCYLICETTSLTGIVWIKSTVQLIFCKPDVTSMSNLHAKDYGGINYHISITFTSATTIVDAISSWRKNNSFLFCLCLQTSRVDDTHTVVKSNVRL